MNTNIFLSGVLELVKDLRDFSFHKVYGQVAPPQIPNIDFDIADGFPIIIDQSSTEDCTGATSSELNTVFSTDEGSLVNYLNKKGLPSNLNYRASQAVKYGLIPSMSDYINLANKGLNGDINSALLAALRYDNGDYFDYLYQYSKICQTMGQVSLVGADIRTGMQSLAKYGSLPKNQSPFSYNEGKTTDRNVQFLSDWKNWPVSLDTIAAKNKIPSFFAITGSFDAFDNIRSALWISKQQKLKAGVNFGMYYKRHWINPVGGIITDDGTDPTSNTIGGHDMWARGQKMINGVPYLKVQQSWGKNFGDKGVYYFPRSVVNQMVALFGAFAPTPLPKQTAINYLQSGIMAGDNWFTRIIKTILKSKPND